VAGRAPGSATSAPLSLKGRSDKAVPYPKWRALVRGHARAQPRGAPARRAGARLLLEGARSGDNGVIAPCPRGSWLPSPPRPGWTARRARKAPSSSVQLHATSSTLPAGATPRQAGPADGHRRRAPARARRRSVGEVARAVTACVAAMARPLGRPAGGPRRSHEPQAKARGPGGRNAITSRAAHQDQTHASIRPASGRATRPPFVVTLRGA